MQANHRSHRTLHGVEHDEIDACRLGFPCEPMPAPTGTVAVPATGTVLVVDGVVQDIADVETEECLRYRQLGPGTSYFLYVSKPDDFAIGDRVRADSPGMTGTATVTAVGVNYLLVIDQLTRQERSVAKLFCRKMEAT